MTVFDVKGFEADCLELGIRVAYSLFSENEKEDKVKENIIKARANYIRSKND